MLNPRRVLIACALLPLLSSTSAVAEPYFEPVVAAPRLVSPEAGTTIMQNSVFVLHMESGFNREESFVSVRINEEPPVVVDLDRDACSFRNACTGVVGPFALNDGDEVVLEAFDVDAEEEGASWRFTASDVVDTTAPSIAPTSITMTGIQASGGSESYGPVTMLVECRPEKTIQLAAQVANDENLVDSTYLVRVDGEAADGPVVGLLGVAENDLDRHAQPDILALGFGLVNHGGKGSVHLDLL